MKSRFPTATESRIRELEAATAIVLSAVAQSPRGEVLCTPDEASWNPDFHIEITLSVREIFMIRKANGMEMFKPRKAKATT